MRLRIALLIGIVLILAGLALWGSQVLAAAPAGYTLDLPAWEVEGALAGGDYRLVPPGEEQGNGTPCCCLHVPCVMKK